MTVRESAHYSYPPKACAKSEPHARHVWEDHPIKWACPGVSAATTCPACEGTGESYDPFNSFICSTCNGSGESSAARTRPRWLRSYRFEDGPMPWYMSWFASFEGRVRYIAFRLRRAIRD